VPERGQVEFSVIDNGRGVPLEKQAQIFKAYGQANSSDARVGTGLGLAICQSIIEAHGGTIGVESREHKDNRGDGGSRFWFRLPVLAVPLE
jgi:signal transduction histidine kinase